MKSLRDPPTPVDSPPLTNCRVPQVWGQEKDVLLPRSFFMSQMLRMLEMQGMQPQNLQDTRDIDQTQKIRELWGMLGMQPASHKKVQKTRVFQYFPKAAIKNRYQQPPSNTLRIDFQKHDNAGDVSQELLRTGGELQENSFFADFNSSSSVTALGFTQTSNRPIPTSLETAKRH